MWEDITNEEEEEREKRRAKTAPLQRRGWSQVRADGRGCVSRTSCYTASYLSCDSHVTLNMSCDSHVTLNMSCDSHVTLNMSYDFHVTASLISFPQNAVKIKTKDGDRLHLQAPSKLTGDYDPDFESTVDEGVAAGMSVSKGGGVG